MSDLTPDIDLPAVSGGRKKRGAKLGLFLGFLLICLAGGAGFYAGFKSLVSLPFMGGAHDAAVPRADLVDVQFLPIEPMIIGMSPGRQMRFSAQLETNAPYLEEVSKVMPRIQDVMNGYLRAVDPKSLEQPAVLTKLRAQLLRRVQIVTGPDRVRDLLITEFVIN